MVTNISFLDYWISPVSKSPLQNFCFVLQKFFYKTTLKFYKIHLVIKVIPLLTNMQIYTRRP